MVRISTILMLPISLATYSLANPLPSTAMNATARNSQDMSARSANTCADPSLARTVFQAFNGNAIFHVLNFHENVVDQDSAQPSGPALLTIQGPAFKAFPTQQVSTVPLFRMTSTSELDHIFEVGTDAQTPPVINDFSARAIIAWVYNTPICGSVPLLSASLASASDHYYTTDALEHAGYLALGWTDSGVTGFVLPLPTF